MSDLDRDLQVFREAYEEAQGGPLRRASLQQWREEGRHFRRLRALCPDNEERHAFLRAWAEETDAYVVAQGHLLRHALLEWRFHRLIQQAHRDIEDANYLKQFEPQYCRGCGFPFKMCEMTTARCEGPSGPRPTRRRR